VDSVRIRVEFQADENVVIHVPADRAHGATVQRINVARRTKNCLGSGNSVWRDIGMFATRHAIVHGAFLDIVQRILVPVSLPKSS
jgi:hypothetical protein